MLTEAELEKLFDGMRHSAFRLETLPVYDVPGEADRKARYFAGESMEPDDATREYLEMMQAEISSGKRWHKVHVLTRPLTPYLRFECEAGYAISTRYGQEVGILDITDRAAPPALVGVGDFWLFDNETVALLRYEDGRFLGAELAPTSVIPQYRTARDVAEASAVPFTEWWAAHPEYRREHQKPA
ncbi:DUF6879 family protein [Allonocardiopsis opalescens]|uniref:DUF6879 domain-containing protein n=1 Tax=Allonocardiopsis opalescens TaxID=1144618 RepID=A0A2T0Q5Q8_9ACTN|nr:DUF6879 family protein [Allonocardiopsis opalescens]PRX99122.1 hypothetical protein CLV72_104702 [Allonocardiopsis opalescens]